MNIRESGSVITIGNEFIELGFDAARNGALISIVDLKTNYMFQRDADAPKTLFRIALRNKKDCSLEWLDSRDAGKFEWSRRQSEESLTVIMKNSGFKDKSLEVIVEVSILNCSQFSFWRIYVNGLWNDEAIHQITCPIVSGIMRIGSNVPGETIVTSRNGEGHIFRNPYPVEDRLPLKGGYGLDVPNAGMGEVHGMYPGRQSMQFMLYYNDTAGLYFAAHDNRMNVKSFDIGQMADWGMFPVVSISHFPGEQDDNKVTLNYDTVIGTFHGDWYDGADIYKEWAVKQWWCGKTLWERDIPDWMRKGFGIFEMSNYSIPELKLNHSLMKIANVVNELSQEIGVPLLALIFNWEGKGAWTAPKGMFPPREGEEKFKSAMRLLNDKGNYGFVYIAAANWYIKLPYNPVFDSWKEFEEEGRQNTITDFNGKVRIESWFKGWEHTHTCPGTEYVKEQTASEITGCLELGCTVVQIDNFPACEPEACFNSKHGHPAGYGSWWAEEFNTLLVEARRKAKEKNPEYALSSEGICECFIQNLEMFDQRAGNFEYFCHLEGEDFPAGGDCIPLFSYVYNKYIASYLAAFNECNRPEVLYWTRSLGKSLAQGAIPTGGWFFPKPDVLNPITIGFYKKITRASARECWKYYVFGEMLKPPVIDIPMITVSYLKPVENVYSIDEYDRHLLKDYAVQHSAWRAMDGDIGYFFINISEDEVAFDVELSSYGNEAKLFNVTAVTDGTRFVLAENTALPLKEHINMAPLSVTLVEIKEVM